MQIAIEHTTRYAYETDASYSVLSLRLTPASFAGQNVLDWQVTSEPPGETTASRDGFGNVMHLMTVSGPHRELAITARGTVEVEDRNGVVQGLTETVPLRVYLKRTPLTTPSDAILELARADEKMAMIPRLHALMDAIRDRVEYQTGTTTTATTAAQAMAAGSGVCQDHAHIFIAAARAIGVPARYVTGYMLLQDEGAKPAAAHHAWAEAYVESLGWIGFDAANRQCPTNHYVRLAASLDAFYAAPIRGTRRGGESETLEVKVTVESRAAAQSQSQSQGQQSQTQSQQ